MSKTLLSILICTLPERKEKLKALCTEILKQNEYTNGIQLLWDDTPRGEITIGGKRNKLKYAANGEYVAYLDDDDMITPNYLQLMLEGCRTGKDIVTFDFDYYVDGKYLKTNVVNRFWGKNLPYGENDHCSKQWAVNYNPSHRFTVAETFYHLCAVKKELADQVTFIDANNAEDVGYSNALIPLIKSEFHIEHTLLNVYYSTTKEQNV